MLTEIELQGAMYTIVILCTYINLGIALYGVLAKPNLIKKLIMLTIFGDSSNLFAILIGYRLWRPDILLQPPVLLRWELTPEVLRDFLERAVDPLPQALVLTAIVIGLAVTLFLASMVVLMYKHFGTVDANVIGEIKKRSLVNEDR